MFADTLFRWMSEVGDGELADLRGRVEWIARTADVPIGMAASGRWLRDMSALGHVEIDWVSGRWATAPPAVVLLPAADGLGVLAGSRRYDQIGDIEASDVAVHQFRPPNSPRDVPAPTCVFVQFDSLSDLRLSATRAGAAYAGCTAVRLARSLAPLKPGKLAAPPSRLALLESVIVSDSGVSYAPADGKLGDGVYRVRLQGRQRHLYRHEDSWFWCELAEGVFLDLARRGESVMRWRPESGAGRAGVGEMFVDWGAPLPPLHARALTLCSGLPARFYPAARTAEYANVPRSIARAIAESLGQPFREM